MEENSSDSEEATTLDDVSTDFCTKCFGEKKEVPISYFIDALYCEVFGKCVQNCMALLHLKVMFAPRSYKVTLLQFDRVLSLFGPLDTNFLERLNGTMNLQWFHGDINVNEAERRLSNCAAGTFLVRMSSQRNCFAMSKRTACILNKVAHTRILLDQLEYFRYISIDKLGFIRYNSFKGTLSELVENMKEPFELTQECSRTLRMNSSKCIE